MLMITEVGNSMVTLAWTTGEKRMSPHQLVSDFYFSDLQILTDFCHNHGSLEKNTLKETHFCWEPFSTSMIVGGRVITGFYR